MPSWSSSIDKPSARVTLPLAASSSAIVSIAVRRAQPMFLQTKGSAMETRVLAAVI